MTNVTERIDIIRADDSHLEQVRGILNEAAVWRLARCGLNDWPIPFPPEVVAEHIQTGQTHLAKVDDMPVATVSLEWQDESIWGPGSNSAAYIHRLAVARSFAGRGVAAQILDWASETAAEQGRTALRLDCNAANERLRAHYEQMGFLLVETRSIIPMYVAAKYERPTRPS